MSLVELRHIQMIALFHKKIKREPNKTTKKEVIEQSPQNLFKNENNNKNEDTD